MNGEDWQRVAPPGTGERKGSAQLSDQALDPTKNEHLEENLPRNAKVRRIKPMGANFYNQGHGG